MSKKQTTTAPSLSESTKRTIYIAVIIAVAAIIIAISLALILQPGTTPVTPDEIADKDGGVTPSSSSTTVKNGTFEGWTIKQDNETFPLLANKWWNAFTRNTDSSNGSTTSTTRLSQVISSDSSEKDVDQFRTNGSAVYGIIDTADTKDSPWSKVTTDLKELGITLSSNPGAREGSEDSNIYMIAANKATSVAILSQRISVTSGSYVKIGMYINTTMLKGEANIVLQEGKYYSSSVSVKTDDTGMYVTETLTPDTDTNNAWKYIEFYLFNKSGSTKYTNVSINMGSVYANDTTGSGFLFVDDITYETVSSNDYRLHHEDIKAKVFDSEDKDTTATSVAMTGLDGSSLTAMSASDYLNEAAAKYNNEVYSPYFGDEQIYKVSANGTSKNVVGMRVDKVIDLVKSNTYGADCAHISFALRMSAEQRNTTAKVVVEKLDASGNPLTEPEYATTFTAESVEDISAADANCGWKLYHIYLKPSDYPGITDKVRITLYIGSEKEVEDVAHAFKGTLYATNVLFEMVTQQTYSNGDNESDSVVKKASMSTVVSNVEITNGSFSSWDKVNNQPSGWTPVFGGSNDIFKDGKGNKLSGDKIAHTAVEGSGVVQNTTDAPATDDDVKNILQVSANGTSFGYMSSSMSLSANQVYLISVLAKVSGSAKPSIHLVDTTAGSERADKVIASITATADSSKVIDDIKFAENGKEGDGWTRYYFVIVTGAKSRTVRLVLMNGDILGETDGTDTVCYDIASKKTIGSYSLAQEKDTDTEKTVTFTATSGYTAFDELLKDDNFKANKLTNVKTVHPTDAEWTEMKKIEKTDDTTDDDNKTPDTTVKSEVDLGLLFSVLSSVLLVAALAVVVVVRIFKKRA